MFSGKDKSSINKFAERMIKSQEIMKKSFKMEKLTSKAGRDDVSFLKA